MLVFFQLDGCGGRASGVGGVIESASILLRPVAGLRLHLRWLLWAAFAESCSV